MQLPVASTILALLPAVSSTLAPQPQYVFSNAPPRSTASGHRIPSIHESTVQARRILHLSNIATLSTVFPSNASSFTTTEENPSTLEDRPPEVAGASIGLMEYYASCAPHVYNPTLLGVTIATTMKNAAAGSNVTMSLRYHPPRDAPPRPDDPWAYLPANLPRFALIGYLERIGEKEAKREGIRHCFLRAHPEGVIWEPGSDVHDSWWGRLVVREVYFFGGFGDRARIGWLPLEEWIGVKQKEVEEYRLVGEEGYEEWVQRRRYKGDEESTVEEKEEEDEPIFRIQPVDL